MGRLVGDSIFTNNLLEETIDNNILFENIERVYGLSNLEFKDFLFLATKEH